MHRPALLALAAALAASGVAQTAARTLGVHRRPTTTSSTSSSCTMPDARPLPQDRLFTSPAIEAAISSLLPKFRDPNLGRLFANALPNALDTTVYRHENGTSSAPLDTFMITGDIAAMWLRDSTNQVLPYLRYVKQDPSLQALVAGVIARHARSILIDPYANAFQVDATAGQGPHADDSTTRPAFAGTTIDAMTPAIFERKWELDSLANPMRLAALYFNATGGDTAPFTPDWLAAMSVALDTIEAQQLDTEEEDARGGPPYVFQRTTGEPTDTLEHGRGPVAKRTGMVKCGFRGSDDALTLPFNIPENAFAASSLRLVSVVFAALNATDHASRALLLASEIEEGIRAFGVFTHPTAGQIYAYEVDGYGNAYFMDDANIPGLLSMPMYGFAPSSDPLYQATRAAVLSAANPYFLCGAAGCGVGGPHNGFYWVWPMSIAARAYTSTDDGEISYCLSLLVNSSACTGLVHESYDRNDFGTYTRPWFAWMNSLFADLVLKIADERPYLIF